MPGDSKTKEESKESELDSDSSAQVELRWRQAQIRTGKVFIYRKSQVSLRFLHPEDQHLSAVDRS